MTEQRRVIIEETRKTDCHPTASDVYDMVRARLPRISLGTVYRNLEMLSDIGIFRRLDFGDTKRRYDSTPDKHYHIRCVNCGKVKDIDICKLDCLCPDEINDCGWKIIGHNLEVLGLCPECKISLDYLKKSNKEEKNV